MKKQEPTIYEEGETYFVPVSQCRISKVQGSEKLKQYVYDMEVDDSRHSFFANGILVHNSIYVRMDNVLKKLFGTTKIDWYDDKTFQKIKKYVDTDFQKLLNDHVRDFICKRFMTTEKRIEFKREKISSEGDYLAKKRYAVHVRDNEGVECDKFAYVGVDVAKNELPSKIKGILIDLVQKMMKDHWKGSQMIHQELSKIYDEYMTFDLNDIAYIKNLSTAKHAVSIEESGAGNGLFSDEHDENFLRMEKGAGVHARAAEYYNQIIKDLHLDTKYESIREGERFHYMYVIPDNKYQIDCIGWKDKYPKEFKKIFQPDIYQMFQKTVISPLKTFLVNHDCASFDARNVVMTGEDGKTIFDI